MDVEEQYKDWNIFLILVTVLILDGNSDDSGAHVWSDLSNLICWIHLIRARAAQILFFLGPDHFPLYMRNMFWVTI